MDAKKKSKALPVPMSAVKSIIQEWKVFVTTRALPESGHPSKLDGGNWSERLPKGAHGNSEAVLASAS